MAVVYVSDCATTTDQKSFVTVECASEIELPDDDHETALLKADSSGTQPPGDLSESDAAMQLSSLDVSPITKIFNWLDLYAAFSHNLIIIIILFNEKLTIATHYKR